MYTLVGILRFFCFITCLIDGLMWRDTCLGKIDLHEFILRVLSGLTVDSDKIEVISRMILFRSSQVAPTTVSPRGHTASGTNAAVTKDTVNLSLQIYGLTNGRLSLIFFVVLIQVQPNSPSCVSRSHQFRSASICLGL